MESSLLNRQIHWVNLAAALEIPISDQTLPALVVCPLCQQLALRVYEGLGDGGPWLHCKGCGLAGDGPEAAAAVWGVPIETAIARLSEDGVLPEGTDGALYIERIVGRDRRIADLWREAQARLPNHGLSLIGKLLDRCRISTDMSAERWRAGPAELVGAVSCRTVEKTWQPNCVIETPRLRSPGTRWRTRSEKRVFRGYGWSDVLALPFHSAPGRFSGFLFVGRLGRREDRVYRACRNRTKHPSLHDNSGLFGLSTLGGAPACVAIGDALFALRLHMRHYRVSPSPVPLVAYHDDPSYPTRNWQAIENRRLVVWMLKPTAEGFAQAIQGDADVTIAGPEREQTQHVIDTYVRLDSTADIVRRVLRCGRPWQDVFATVVRDATDGWIDDTLRQLKARGLDPNQVVLALKNAEARERLLAWLDPDHRRGARYARHGDWMVSERTTGWHVKDMRRTKLPKQISNFTLRLGPIGGRGHGQRSGVVIYRDREYPVRIAPDGHHGCSIETQIRRQVAVPLYVISPYWWKALPVLADLFGGACD